MRTQTVQRTIHFYHLDFLFGDQDDLPYTGREPFLDLFNKIAEMSKSKDPRRYFPYGEKQLFINHLQFDGANKVIKGKLWCVRKNMLPELIDTILDETEELQVKDHEGIVDTTHFIIDYSSNHKTLALEYNQFGAKVSDFRRYIEAIGRTSQNLEALNYGLVTTEDQLEELLSYMNNMAELYIRVHKTNLDFLKDVDDNLYSEAKHHCEYMNSEFYNLSLDFNPRSASNFSITDRARELMRKVVDLIQFNPQYTEYLHKFQVRAQDSRRNNKLESFDLLLDKVKSLVDVEKKLRHNSISSEDMYTKMLASIIEKRFVISRSKRQARPELTPLQ